ncbi:DNA-binding response OmpR family regulator [Allocatelliglobosispora scoriae]|uniref:DNA-binding response OmpR family regulator n=1 Tax=Allocatelliglobosispora scoriae TaxID=643052 RepID=A0A841C0L0_9ACTN|nr:winged helix-turn-helix domain-containing protein [Allocatelliglobosispora scoriae]MBB5873278.1 DNA-binding response OmpR family regulator [Allocatelliglobosispora scoriae]
MELLDRPLIVCVTSDVAVREKLVRQLDPHGVVLICADLEEVRTILFPVAPAEAPLHPDGVLTVGDLVVDPVGYRVTWRGEPLPLTRLERRLLGCLAVPPLEVWTYQRLFTAVWGGAYLGDTSILHSAVKRLRGKLRAVGQEMEVETVRAVGYRLTVTS